MNKEEKGSKTSADGSYEGDFYGVDFNYLNTILCGDENEVNDFLKHAINDIHSIKKEFAIATKERDEQKFDKVIHKAKWIFKMLGVSDAKNHLSECKELIKNEDLTDKNYEVACKKCLKIFDQLLTSIQKRISQ